MNYFNKLSITALILMFFCGLVYANSNAANFKVNEEVLIQWHGAWHPGTIIEIGKNKYKVHYFHYQQSWDEWVAPSRLQLKKNNTIAVAPHEFKINEEVLAFWHKQWYPAQILAINGKKYRIHYLGYDSYWDDDVDRKHLLSIGEYDQQAIHLPEPPIFSAVAENNLSKVEHLLKSGVNINTENHQGATPLQIAVIHKNKSLVEFLIAQGANVNALDHHQQSALLWAAHNRDWKLLHYLLTKGANPNLGHSALHFAITSGQSEVVEMLIKHGANVNTPLTSGITPLQLAKNFHQQSIIDLLTDAGAK